MEALPESDCNVLGCVVVIDVTITFTVHNHADIRCLQTEPAVLETESNVMMAYTEQMTGIAGAMYAPWQTQQARDQVLQSRWICARCALPRRSAQRASSHLPSTPSSLQLDRPRAPMARRGPRGPRLWSPLLRAVAPRGEAQRAGQGAEGAARLRLLRIHAIRWGRRYGPRLRGMRGRTP